MKKLRGGILMALQCRLFAALVAFEQAARLQCYALYWVFRPRKWSIIEESEIAWRKQRWAIYWLVAAIHILAFGDIPQPRPSW